ICYDVYLDCHNISIKAPIYRGFYYISLYFLSHTYSNLGFNTQSISIFSKNIDSGLTKQKSFQYSLVSSRVSYNAL
ncbi:MAG: hypothetical protein Q8M44_02180, partial [bacterium]|nr:hypothetical protein [bacterium]